VGIYAILKQKSKHKFSWELAERERLLPQACRHCSFFMLSAGPKQAAKWPILKQEAACRRPGWNWLEYNGLLKKYAPPPQARFAGFQVFGREVYVILERTRDQLLRGKSFDSRG
jgi:hypothetical protein